MTPLELSKSDAQFGASLTNEPRVIIYNCDMFIIDATGYKNKRHF